MPELPISDSVRRDVGAAVVVLIFQNPPGHLACCSFGCS
jgi:hypothetical protein